MMPAEIIGLVSVAAGVCWLGAVVWWLASEWDARPKRVRYAPRRHVEDDLLHSKQARG